MSDDPRDIELMAARATMEAMRDDIQRLRALADAIRAAAFEEAEKACVQTAEGLVSPYSSGAYHCIYAIQAIAREALKDVG